MDGWEFLEEYELVDQGQRARIVIVMLTTSLNSSDMARAQGRDEIARFRNKPLTFDMLDEILQDYFSEWL